MPKCRIVKSEFLMDERLSGLDPLAVLYLLGASTMADPYGVLENRPLRIKVASHPHGPENPDEVIRSLSLVGILAMSEDYKYLKIVPFLDWFKPFNNELITNTDQSFSCGTPVEHGEAWGKLGVSLVQASSKDKEKERSKEKKDSLFPIRDSKDPELADWYLETVAVYPTKDEGHNARSGAWETRRVQRDSPQAQKNFHALTSSGAVSARELYVCAWLASDHWRKAKGAYNFVPNLSSFFSSGEKAPWCNWIEDARTTILEQESEATA